MSRPDTNSRVSPGRKNPSRIPHSAKMIKAMPRIAHDPIESISEAGLSQPGRMDIATGVTTLHGPAGVLPTGVQLRSQVVPV